MERDGEELNKFSSLALVHALEMSARGEDFVGTVGVGGGWGIKFALREVRKGEGVCGR